MDPGSAFLMDRVLVVLEEDLTVWVPDGGVSSSNDPSCPSHCPAVPTGLYPGDGPVYYNKQLPLGVLDKSFPLEKPELSNYADSSLSKRKGFAVAGR